MDKITVLSVDKGFVELQNEVRTFIRALKEENRDLRAENVSLKCQLGPARKESTPEKNAVFYTVGQRFRSPARKAITDDTYLLAQIGEGEVSLIGLKSGNRWDDPMNVLDSGKIPQKDFDKHFSGPNAPEWKLVL